MRHQRNGRTMLWLGLAGLAALMAGSAAWLGQPPWRDAPLAAQPPGAKTTAKKATRKTAASDQASPPAQTGAGSSVEAQWIWYDEGDPRVSAPDGAVYFRRVFDLPEKPRVESAQLVITADNVFHLHVNEQMLGFNDKWQQPGVFDVAKSLRGGSNVIAVRGVNQGVGPAGVMVALDIRLVGGSSYRIQSDSQWRTLRAEPAPANWHTLTFDDSAWKPAMALGAYGKTPPWNTLPERPANNPAERFTVPEGFVVEQVADAKLTGSVVRFAFDHQGRPLVSRERGPLLVLEGFDPPTQRYTNATVITEAVTNCQGLFDHLGTIYAVGSAPGGRGASTGLYRISPQADGSPRVELLRASKGGMGEHGPHQISVGPDGRLWMCLGNHASLPPYAENSPVRDWYEGQLLSAWNDSRGHASNIRAPGGTILRSALPASQVGPDSAWSLETTGFRNQYAFAFDDCDELFSWDSDMEWDLDLPWYRPVRVNHAVAGADFGWRTGAGKWPDYLADSLGTVIDVGRGSPCGMVFYHHGHYPAKYHGALLITDWSLGRILAIFTKPDGAGYKATMENFVVGRPLNVTDVDVGPDGNVYFSTGGRNTEGGLYRIRWTGQPGGATAPTATETAVTVCQAIEQLQPQSAWAMAAIEKVRQALGANWATQLTGRLTAADLTAPEARAIVRLMRQYGPAPEAAVVAGLVAHGDAGIRAVGLRLVADTPGQATIPTLVAALSDTDAVVRRRALEGLLRQSGPLPVEPLMAVANDSDRTIRYLAMVALKRTETTALRSAALAATAVRSALAAQIALTVAARNPADTQPLLTAQLALLDKTLADTAGDVTTLLDLIRAVGLTVMVAEDGLDALNAQARPRAGEPLPPPAGEIGQRLLAVFPHRDWRVNREIARLCCRLSTEGVQDQLLAAMRGGASREQQIHYAYCLRAAQQGWTETTRQTMFDWFVAAQAWTGGNSFGGHVDIIFAEWLKTCPPQSVEALRQQRAALKPKEPERLPVKPAASKYGFDELVSHLAVHKGDAVRGQVLMEKAQCIACHRWGGRGEGAGPDLTDVGRRFQAKDLVESIIYPSKVISDQYQGWVWRLEDDRIITGVIATQDDTTITIIGPDAKKLVLDKSDIAETKAAKQSIMPEGLLNPLSLAEIADLFAALEAGPTAR